MHFVANIHEFIGAMVIGGGIAIGWTIGCWAVNRLLRVVKL